MDIMWIDIAVDLTLYVLLGAVIVRLGKRFLPDPWNEASFTIPVVFAIGTLLTLVTFPHWIVFPR